MTRTTCLLTLGLVVTTACSAPAPEPATPQSPTSAAPAASGPVTPPGTDTERIASAAAAAPDAISRDAKIINMDDMRTLREGNNGWTCFPDFPATPGADPMCLDQNGLAWADAWMKKQDPPAGKMGFGYMLMGGSDASNTDPFATAPAPDGKWVDTGPHVMVFNIGDAFAGYPTTADNPQAPFVMFAGTKYAHLMLPVK